MVQPSALNENDQLPRSFQSLQLLTDPEEWALRQEEIHNSQMRLYEEKFENNKIMYFHDLWEYVERRLSNGDGATEIRHPNNPEQHASAPKGGPLSHAGATKQPYLFVKQGNETDQMNNFSGELQKLIEDEHTPEWVKEQARL